MAWRRTGAKPLSELTMTQFSACMQHYGRNKLKNWNVESVFTFVVILSHLHDTNRDVHFQRGRKPGSRLKTSFQFKENTPVLIIKSDDALYAHLF